MGKTSKALETASNIAVIIMAIIFAIIYLPRSFENNQPQAPRVGETLPELKGYSWQSNPHTLVLVLRKGCHFCEESMPFYRALYDEEKDNGLTAKMIAVFPDLSEDVNRILLTQDLPIPGIPQIDPSSLQVSGTPTLILVDGSGKVERTWVGELDSAGEENVLKAVRKPPADSSNANSSPTP